MQENIPRLLATEYALHNKTKQNGDMVQNPIAPIVSRFPQERRVQISLPTS